jgi:hypothetical protein
MNFSGLKTLKLKHSHSEIACEEYLKYYGRRINVAEAKSKNIELNP